MPLVRPTVVLGLTLLKDDFVHSYRDGAAVFYVSTTNEQGLVDSVTSKDFDVCGSI
jgi:hypothetical protein